MKIFTKAISRTSYILERSEPKLESRSVKTGELVSVEGLKPSYIFLTVFGILPAPAYE